MKEVPKQGCPANGKASTETRECSRAYDVANSHVLRGAYHTCRKPIRVLAAPVEIAQNSSNFTAALKEYNITLDIIDLWKGGPMQDDKTNLDLAILDGLKTHLIKTVIRLARTYDLIYFQFGSTVLDTEYLGGKKMTPPYPDLNIVKGEGAKIAAAYWGSDIWDPAYFVYHRLQALGFNDIDKVPFSSRYKQGRIEIMSLFADFVLTSDCLSDLFPKLVNGDTPIDLTNWPFVHRKFDRKRLKVAHMPSNRYKKNTDIILKIMSELEEKGIVESILIENIPNNEVIHYLHDCDLFIDCMVHDFGKASVEAMALGIPSITRSNEPFKGQRGRAPVILVKNQDELRKKIIELNGHREVLQELSSQGREYVEKYHDKDKIADGLARYIFKAVSGEQPEHIISDRTVRERMFDTQFYEQALPILAKLQDVSGLATCCLSGIENHISVETCYRYLELLRKNGIYLN
jgi:hypothetical protein